LENAEQTVDRDKQRLEMQFARMFLERLRQECAKSPEVEIRNGTSGELVRTLEGVISE
jgi:hypothetical protein